MPRHAMTREQALKVLELHAGASFQEIKQAYRDLAVVWHPDRFARHDARLREKASERLKEINTAYDVLRSYDDGPSRPNEPRTKHTGTRQGASGTEQSETQRQRSRTKNRSTGSSGEPSESRNSRNRLGRLWNRWSALARGGIERVPTPVAIVGHFRVLGRSPRRGPRRVLRTVVARDPCSGLALHQGPARGLAALTGCRDVLSVLSDTAKG